MTKPEIVDWLLNNDFEQISKTTINYCRVRTETFRGASKKVYEYVNVWAGAVFFSNSGDYEDFYGCGINHVHIDEKNWLILEGIWELRPKEEIRE